MSASSQAVRDRIEQLDALGSAVCAAKLRAIAEYDEAESWREDGATCMSQWLSTCTGAKPQTCREQVRVAHALRQLPVIADQFEQGALSWDQVVALTRFATAETDELWAERARSWSVWALEREARRHEQITAEQDETEHDARFLRAWWSRDRRALKLHGRLPAEDGARVLTALQRRADQQPDHPDTGEPEPFERRMADALRELAGIATAQDHDPDRSTVVTYISEQTLLGGLGLAELEDGARLRLEAIQRMLCDCRIEFAIQDDHGRTVGIGRCSRVVPAWLERQVVHRDGHCQFPGCDRTTLLHSHHAIHWLNLGPTNFNNLVAICATHHRAVHELGWRVIPLGEGRFRFVRPDGIAILPRRPVLRDTIRRRFLDTERAIEADDTS